MRSIVYIISDLHLGGVPDTGEERGFQMCPAPTQTALAAFIGRLPGREVARDCRLVIAGDIVDFLAEEPPQAFTDDPVAACSKLQAIFDRTAPVWAALRRFVGERQGWLTLMLGNHDIELSLPGPRELLLEHLGPGRIDFVYDNEAVTYGPLLIEHGNRFDAWNAVPHGALRRVRSQLSRKLPVSPPFPAMPGSRLVVDVMNPLKKTYAFVDLLKPEDAAALPVIAALGAPGFHDIWNLFVNYRRQWAADYDEETGEPVDESFAAAGEDAAQKAYNFANAIASGAVGMYQHAAGAVSDGLRAARLKALFAVVQHDRDTHDNALAVDQEVPTYLVPAQRAANAGFRIVVYGHTHLAKRIALDDGATAAPLYLNTGTWADLMCVPEEVWGEDADAARQALIAFVEGLEGNRLAKWRRPVPTYALIELDGDAVLHADVHFADDDTPISTAGLKKRLRPLEATRA
jgi:UDP-2,3-diacylglucosamine pyrophosphatase LpxH